MHSHLSFQNPPALRNEALELAKSLAARAEADPTDVDGRALDGYDDARSFLHLW